MNELLFKFPQGLAFIYLFILEFERKLEGT